MGARASRLRPEVVNELKKETDFSDEQIRRYYRKFRKDYCEQGTMDVCESTFLERCLAGKASFYMEDCRRFASEVFRMFDCDNSGMIDFYEFLTTLVIIKHGTLDEQAEWMFRLYDQNGDGILTKEEVMQKVDDLHAILGAALTCCEDCCVAESFVDHVFSRADENQDGVLSESEFVGAVKKSQTVHNLFLDTSNAVRCVFIRQRN